MKIKEMLKNAGKKVTPERVVLFKSMENRHLFESKDLVILFPDIGRASIFRTIKLFCEIGVLRRVNLGKSGKSYEVECCKKHHHEHMKCVSCGDVLSFESESICKKLFSEAKRFGFNISEHSVNILGTCKKCSL